ncbi:MAG TPA: hypothetical protein VF198_12870 [Vicinamibacterales bacterium]
MRTLACLLTLLAALAASPAAAQTTEMTMYVSVLDGDRRPVSGLGPEDFVVREDGRAREVLRAGRTSDPIELAVLIDNSQAMQPHILDLRRALTPFLTRLAGEQANIVLIGMGDRPTVLAGYTQSAAELTRAVERIFALPSSGMVFQDSVNDATRGLVRRENPRRVLLAVMGEGADFSNIPYQHTLETLKDSGVQFHAVVLTDSRRGFDSQTERERGIVLDEGVQRSGGRRHDVLTSMAFGDALETVAEDLLNQYKVVYARPGALVPPTRWEVDVKRPGATASGTLVRPEPGGTK